jgi:hypothetical protein
VTLTAAKKAAAARQLSNGNGGNTPSADFAVKGNGGIDRFSQLLRPLSPLSLSVYCVRSRLSLSQLLLSRLAASSSFFFKR